MMTDRKHYNILVIEDNPGDFVIIDDFLRENILYPKITQARSFTNAVALLSGNHIVFDVILLDLSLPDKSGQELVTSILNSTSFPVIILTGYTDIDFSIKSISEGIFDYLVKDELNATILYKSILYAIERYKTISELRKSEKRSSDLFHLSPQPMLVYDPETFRFIQVNKAAIDHYGYSNEEFMVMNMLGLGVKEEILRSKEILDRQREQGDMMQKEKFIHQKKGGEIIEVELFASPVVINDKKFSSVIVIDVTDRNLYEKNVIKAIIKTQEDERYEIGGELHDNVCQLLATSQMSLGLLKASIPSLKMPLFDQCKSYLSLALHEIRNLSHRLAPAFFDDSGLKESLTGLFNSFNMEGNPEICLYFDEAICNHDISLDIQLTLYRILQEQLRNIQKYANAGLIEIDIVIHNEMLKMRIYDDGVGFNVLKVSKGIGLANMKRRTELFAGKFQLESSPGEGCTISIEIPLIEVSNLYMQSA